MLSFHEPVMLSEAISLMNVKSGGVYVDTTLGGGGHTRGILQHLKAGHVYGFDQDAQAVNQAKQNLKEYLDKLTFYQTNFSQLRTNLALDRIKTVDGVLFDLGMSSFQIDAKSRGFSYDADAPLDMRMNADEPISARDVINTASKEELTRIITNYGEEKAAGKIALWIIAERENKPIETTGELSRLIEKKIRGNPVNVLKTKMRVFQAIRIVVNNELDVLQTALTDAVNILNPGGRIVVISYHSLEDKITKYVFNRFAKGCICPPKSLKCICGKIPKLKILTSKPVLPSQEEQQKNRRSRSAKLRAAEKL